MAMSELRRSLHPNEDVTELSEEWRGIVKSFLDNKSRAVKKKAKGERWIMKGPGGDDGDAAIKIITHDGDGVDDDVGPTRELRRMPAVLRRMKLIVCRIFPRIISRIAHATAPILLEISRGYFVPFLTVGLGCLGRVHTLLTRMGRELASALRETVPILRGYREMIESRGTADWKPLEDLVMTRFVVEDDARDDEGRNLRRPTSNNEWNDLMEHFVDVTQDELTKNINDYVKRKRWSGVVSRFGLSKLVVGSNASTAEVISEGDQVDLCVERKDSAFDEDREGRFPSRELETCAASGDLGELVDAHQTSVSATRVNATTGTMMDDNLARIRKERMKRHMDIPPSEAPASKKKSRNKKKGVSNIDEVMCNDERKSIRRKDADGARSAQDIVVGAGTSFPNEIEPKDAHIKRESNISAKSLMNDNCGDAANPPGSVGTDVRRKKSPKSKSTTGRKIKRKSTSVIDNIFKR
jgi:hypothetical protein